MRTSHIAHHTESRQRATVESTLSAKAPLESPPPHGHSLSHHTHKASLWLTPITSFCSLSLSHIHTTAPTPADIHYYHTTTTTTDYMNALLHIHPNPNSHTHYYYYYQHTYTLLLPLPLHYYLHTFSQPLGGERGREAEREDGNSEVVCLF